MNEFTSTTERTPLLRNFVAQSRGHACRVSCYEDKEADLKGPVGFLVISESSLWIAVDGIDDSVEIASEPPALAEAGIVESASRGRWTSFDGGSLVAAWLLTNQQGYTDGLQLCLLCPDEGLIIAQFLAIGSTLSLKTSSAPAAWVGSLSRSGPSSEILKRDGEPARQFAILERAVEDFAALSDVLYRRVNSVVVAVILVFGERAFSVALTESEAHVELLDITPRDCESAVGDDAWLSLVGSGIMWLWCLTDAAGHTTGLQAEFWRSGEPTGTRQLLVVDQELKVLVVQ